MKGLQVLGYGWICDSCLRGTHLSYGSDHRKNEMNRRDCKNVSDDYKNQCVCTPDWPELEEAINDQLMEE